MVKSEARETTIIPTVIHAGFVRMNNMSLD